MFIWHNATDDANNNIYHMILGWTYYLKIVLIQTLYCPGSYELIMTDMCMIDNGNLRKRIFYKVNLFCIKIFINILHNMVILRFFVLLKTRQYYKVMIISMYSGTRTNIIDHPDNLNKCILYLLIPLKVLHFLAYRSKSLSIALKERNRS